MIQKSGSLIVLKQEDMQHQNRQETGFVLPGDRLRGQAAVLDAYAINDSDDAARLAAASPRSPAAESKDSHSADLNSPMSKIVTNKYLINSQPSCKLQNENKSQQDLPEINQKLVRSLTRDKEEADEVLATLSSQEQTYIDT